MEKRLRERHRQIETMHTFSHKKTNFGATSASKCNRIPETGKNVNAAAQNLSHEYTHASFETQRAESASSAGPEHDDDKDVVMGQFRNGCDISFKQVPIDHLLCSRLKNIHMVSAAEKEPAANRSDAETIEAQLATDSVASHSTVISNAGQRTTTSNKPKDSIAESVVSSNDNSSAGGNESIVNTDSENVHITSGAFDLACQAQNLSVPLHACDTSNIHPHSNSANHHVYHNFTSELTNALSSQLLVKLTESSYCNNFASLSRSQRQSSFLKSQSLDIVQDPPSITYIENDEVVFLQLSEVNADEQHQRIPYTKDNQAVIDPTGQENGTNHEAAWAPATNPTPSAQKTGLALKTQSLDSRPIYPNVPYSPYASPYNSPRSNRRRPPLRESRRISIEKSGSFLQLNQYKLMDQIGQVSIHIYKC